MTIPPQGQERLPAALCKELGLRPGSRVVLQRRVIDGDTGGVLRSRKPDWSWIGAARRYAKGKSHRLPDVKRTTARGWPATTLPFYPRDLPVHLRPPRS